MTPSQMLARIEALGSIDAKYIEKIRKQVEDPSKVTTSTAIVKHLLGNSLITEVEAKKLLAPTADKVAAVKPTANSQTQPAKPTIKAAFPPAPEVPLNDNDDDFVPVRSFHPMMILAFLNFHRRYIIGTLLLAFVAYFLVYLNNSNSTDEFNESVAQVNDPTSQSAGTRPTPYIAETVDQGSSEPVPQTVDQQIDWLLTSTNNWQGQAPESQSIFLTLRHAQIEKLIIDHDLKPSQHTYCVQEYIKVTCAMSEINQKINTGLEGIDEKIVKVVQAYEGSEDVDIAALANAAFVSHLAWRFTETPNEENFEIFKAAFLERRDVIAKSEFANGHITKAIRDVVAKASNEPRLQEIGTLHLASVLLKSDEAVIDLAKNLYFPEVDWRSLTTRLGTRSPGADADVQILLARVKDHPDTPLTIYSTICSAAKWYQDIDEDEKAQQILDQLEQIGTTITTKLIHDEVQKGIRLLKDSAEEKKAQKDKPVALR